MEKRRSRETARATPSGGPYAPEPCNTALRLLGSSAHGAANGLGTYQMPEGSSPATIQRLSQPYNGGCKERRHELATVALASQSPNSGIESTTPMARATYHGSSAPSKSGVA